MGKWHYLLKVATLFISLRPKQPPTLIHPTYIFSFLFFLSILFIICFFSTSQDYCITIKIVNIIIYLNNLSTIRFSTINHIIVKFTSPWVSSTLHILHNYANNERSNHHIWDMIKILIHLTIHIRLSRIFLLISPCGVWLWFIKR